ncbi:polysaccharide deacetylase family protein [Ureibacillus acetophenoni]|uniref:Polysaccharide deacetylase n=1 Tax=Ureibacillus acetophenoni TaxID=614649 RepID=A0A285U9P3_9BACL|nr:hypothetical protein [Ureibacillus acetophenoni]SOC38417.1 hypothetical protein SAMN05877842_104127 [Ureibacillus acetophenoni]
MQFTIDAYVKLIELLKSSDYKFCLYDNWDEVEKSVILRHDIDLSLDKAVEIAKVEKELGVKSTYFILLTTNFYNIFSKESYNKIMQIKNLGHVIGLHFDEKRYAITTIDEMENYILEELKILRQLLNEEVNVISMHRPSKLILENDIQIKDVINSYSKKYFKEMKYVSDSRMNWRENVIEIIQSNQYKKLHILTHPFWYSTNDEPIEEKLKRFLQNAIVERYHHLNDNLTDLHQLIEKKEILH